GAACQGVAFARAIRDEPATAGSWRCGLARAATRPASPPRTRYRRARFANGDAERTHGAAGAPPRGSRLRDHGAAARAAAARLRAGGGVPRGWRPRAGLRHAQQRALRPGPPAGAVRAGRRHSRGGRRHPPPHHPPPDAGRRAGVPGLARRASREDARRPPGLPVEALLLAPDARARHGTAAGPPDRALRAVPGRAGARAAPRAPQLVPGAARPDARLRRARHPRLAAQVPRRGPRAPPGPDLARACPVARAPISSWRDDSLSLTKVGTHRD